MKAYGVLALAAGDISAPSIPQNLAAVALNSRTIRLTWDASTDNIGVTGYQLYRDSVPLDTTSALTYDDTDLSPSTQYSYQVAAFDAAGNFSGLSSAVPATTDANTPPQWNGTDGQPLDLDSLAIGASYSRDLNTVCQDIDGDTITYSESATQDPPPSGYTQGPPPGVTFNTALGRYDGTPTTAGSYAQTVDADDGVGGPSDTEAEWTARKASVAGGLILQEDFSTYADRAAWMAYMLSVRNTTNKVSVSYAHTGVSDSDLANYDPVPVGQQEKIGLDTTNFLTGGKSAYLRFAPNEPVSDAGPVFGIPIASPASKMYFQIDVMFDEEALSNDYASSHRKLLFLNAHQFETEQIVGVMYDDHGPWPSGYRIAFSPHTGSTTTRVLARFHTSPPSGFGPSERQVYGAYDTSPGASYPTTVTAFKQRFGPSRDSPDLTGTDPDYAAVPRIIAGRWYTLTYYIDQDWISSTGQRGMWKLWLQEQEMAPVLVGLCFQDCRLGTFASSPSVSIRPVWRPELSEGDPGNFPTGVAHGVRFDKLLVATVPPEAWGFALPYPGQQIPPGMPAANTTDE